jgi:DNA-binding response OmpR family regulator
MLDVNMPEKDGFEIYSEVLAKYPVPVLFVTGYPGSFKTAPSGVLALWNREFDKGNTELLCKPFKIHELHEKVERLLGKTQACGTAE